MNRRQFLRSGLSIGSAAIAPNLSSPSPQSSDRPTPDSPAETKSPDSVLIETYGELALSSDRNYWIWPVELPFEYWDSDYDRLIVDYEVRTPPGIRTPDVLVVDAKGRAQYEATVNPPPKYDVVQKQIPVLGTISWPIIYWENLFTSPNEHEVIWKEDNATYSSTVIDCLSEQAPYSGPLRKSETVSLDEYYVIFDWTETVLSTPSTDSVSAEVSVRVKCPPDEDVDEQVEVAIHDLYSAFDEAGSGIIELAKRIAERICIEIDLPSISGLQKAAPRGTQLASTLNIVLTILQEEIGYTSTVGERIATTTTTWTNWWMTTLPIAHSVQRLHEDACAVTDASPTDVTDRVEDFLLSLGILTADVVLLETSIVNRGAARLVKAAHHYLLGFLRKTLGLRAYVILLREFYNLVRSNTAKVLVAIKDMTRNTVAETDFLDGDDQEKVSQLDDHSLYALDSVALDITPNLLNPECDV